MQPVGVGATDGLPAAVHSLVLSALSSRTVSGTIVVHTADEWYTLRFTNVTLSRYDEKWQDTYASFSTTEFLSPVLYVRFPKPVSVQSVFVNEASTSGETAFGWDAKGNVTCTGGSDISIIALGAGAIISGTMEKSKSTSDLQRLNPIPSSRNAPPDGTPTLTPALTSAPGLTDCAAPFAEATVTRPYPPSFPAGSRGESGESYVQVAIGADGKLVDAWIWGPSGDRAFDLATLQSARHSEYAPARAFCQNVPGMYRFRAEFRP